jgi:predicted P-loop ATPase/GTPase
MAHFSTSSKVDRVILVAPSQKPVIITLEQYLRSK